MTKKPIELTFQVRFEKLKDEVLIKVWCKKNFAITWMSNEQVLKKLVNVEKEQGTKIKIIKDGKKVLAIQKYLGMTAEKIAKKITREITQHGGTQQ